MEDFTIRHFAQAPAHSKDSSLHPATMTTLDQLVDDALVAVMRHLSVDDLLACRLVCKRLGAVALQPEVWRCQRVIETRTCVCPVLRLAPCLDSAVFSRKVHSSAFLTTNCALRELALIGGEGAQFDQGALAIRVQEALGRLRSVKLIAFWPEFWMAKPETAPPQGVVLDTLLEALVECSGLESLELLTGIRRLPNVPTTLSPDLRGPSRPSLKSFQCGLDKHSKTFVNAVLASHAATLEGVDLQLQYRGDNGTDNYSEAAGLIVDMPNLRSLNCELFPGMQDMAGSKVLRDLTITMTKYTRDMVNEWVAALLHKAEQLRTFSIEFKSNASDGAILDDLLQALTSTGQSQLEVLSIKSIVDKSVPPLLRALPQLPALRQLKLSAMRELDDDVIENLLLGITPKKSPALRMLEMYSIQTGHAKYVCMHAWLHSHTIKTFLMKNPSVHVHIRADYSCDEPMCELCPRHREVCRYVETHKLGLFNHAAGNCPSPEVHSTDDFQWKWVHVRDL